MIKKLLLALGAALIAAAHDFDGAEQTQAATPEGEALPKTRGRPPGSKAAPPADEPEKPKGKTADELRAECEPLIKEGRGAEVKVLIKKHGGENLSTIPVANQAAFLKDVEGLSL